MGIFNRKPKDGEEVKRGSDDTLVTGYEEKSPVLLRLFTAAIYIAAVVFLILVEIGSINGKPVIRSTFFLKLNLSNIVPESVPNAQLINSLAQSIGLHDFYQVGLWGFCEGYNGQGITYCSPPQALYWFNPVEILLNELLAGASIALPTELIDVLNIIRTASHWMFALFLVGICLSFLCIFFAPMAYSKKPRWNHRGRRIFFRSLPITILTFLAFLFTAAASVVATVMFTIFHNVLANNADFNIGADVGTDMLAFEWTATGLLLLGLLMQLGTCCGVCCCTGRKKAERRSQAVQAPVVEKDTSSRRRFGFGRRAN